VVAKLIASVAINSTNSNGESGEPEGLARYSEIINWPWLLPAKKTDADRIANPDFDIDMSPPFFSDKLIYVCAPYNASRSAAEKQVFTYHAQSATVKEKSHLLQGLNPEHG
jgi:hypothetical protein